MHTLQKWLAIDSTSGQEREFLEFLETRFTTHGWNVDRQPVADERWNLVVDDDHPTQVLFSTHVDTVPPFLPVERRGEAIYGRGACDTKGGLFAMLTAAEELRDQGMTGIGFLLVVGEEVDHCGAKKARDLDLSPRRIILCEPTENRVVHAQKGMLRFRLCATGVAGHSAYPDDGASAVEPLLDALHRLRRHTWPTDDVLGPTTFNIGVIEGGVAANVFAPDAQAELLFRAVSPVEPLLDEVRRLVGDDADIDDAVYNDPVIFDPPDDVDTCTVPFNTDATYLSTLGDVWLVGPGDIRVAHSDDEHITVDAIDDGVQLYKDLAARVMK